MVGRKSKSVRGHCSKGASSCMECRLVESSGYVTGYDEEVKGVCDLAWCVCVCL